MDKNKHVFKLLTIAKLENSISLQVSLQIKAATNQYVHIGAGTLISKEFVLTAASNFLNNATGLPECVGGVRINLHSKL